MNVIAFCMLDFLDLKNLYDILKTFMKNFHDVLILLDSNFNVLEKLINQIIRLRIVCYRICVNMMRFNQFFIFDCNVKMSNQVSLTSISYM